MSSEPEYEPTPEEIEEACRQIRAGWSLRELKRREPGGKPVRWTVPEVELGTG
ncbi:MAG: hypothetical protein ACE37I_10450 [Rubinisphaera brasiliensis]|uniref:hypothetical protein n=1 Tax=Rubinisphaera brasiliensis TaxID=119 RepID=UPI00391991AE